MARLRWWACQPFTDTQASRAAQRGRHAAVQHVRESRLYWAYCSSPCSPFLVARHVVSSSPRASRVPPSMSSVTSSLSVPSTASSRGTAAAAAMGLESPRRISCSTRWARVPRSWTSSVLCRCPSCIRCRARSRCSSGPGSSSTVHSFGRSRIRAAFHDARTKSFSTSEKNCRVIEGTVRWFSFAAICEISCGGTIMNLSFVHGTPNAIGRTTSPVTQTSVTGTPTTVRSSLVAAVIASSHATGGTPMIQ